MRWVSNLLAVSWFLIRLRRCLSALTEREHLVVQMTSTQSQWQWGLGWGRGEVSGTVRLVGNGCESQLATNIGPTIIMCKLQKVEVGHGRGNLKMAIGISSSL